MARILPAAESDLRGRFGRPFFILASPILLSSVFGIACKTGFLDFSLGLLLNFVGIVVPFSIWQGYSARGGLSEAVRDTALLEGISAGQFFRLISLPLLGPALMASSLFSVMVGWSLFAIAPLVIDASPVFTWPLARPTLGLIEVLIVSSPLLILFILFVWLSRSNSPATYPR